MVKKSNIGKILVGSALAVWALAKQKLRVGVNGIYLNGIISTTLIPLRVSVYILNNTIGRLLVRSISGHLISNGVPVATVNQVINKRIRSGAMVNQDILVDVHSQEALQAILANVNSGDINNLSFEFVGEIVVGEQWPVGIKFNKLFTWQDIQQKLV